MRAGLSTIQQSLTPEAAATLNLSIAEAARRNHGQTTPLHVAATLLSSPTGYLRQACIRSHPNSSHPLQCRALELCFSVALERLPTSQSSIPEPPISNALMAALKRAQAHQRRGCPEQHQQPLLAVKVELDQLIISILDDPSVSRVMREASFSSPAVKAVLEQSINVRVQSGSTASKMGRLGFRPKAMMVPSVSGRNMYANPRLQQQQQGNGVLAGGQRGEELKKVIEILSRTKKRNPILVGETEAEAVVREVLRRIEMNEVVEASLRNVSVISLEKDPTLAGLRMDTKIKELGDLIERRMMSCGGVILDLGDVKWLLDQPTGAQEAGRVVVAEMAKLLSKYGDSDDGGGGRLWLIGTATCETCLRCQVYQPTMETDWDLQVLSIAARAPLPVIFPRLGSNGIISCSAGSFTHTMGIPIVVPPPMRIAADRPDPARVLSCCPQCKGNYEKELSKVVLMQQDGSMSEVKHDAARPVLPRWMQNAKKLRNTDEIKATEPSQGREQDLMPKQKLQELRKKWAETCLRLHPSFHNKTSLESIVPSPMPIASLDAANMLGRQPLKPKLQLSVGHDLQLNLSCGRPISPPPASPVTTDLALGRRTSQSAAAQTHPDSLQDFLGVDCISFESQSKLSDISSAKPHATPDIDSFKRLLKGLMEKVSWQREAASAVASAVTNCKVGNGKQRSSGSKGDMWLLFAGPDKIGKKRMSRALSELVCGVDPLTISLGSKRDGVELDVNIRGKTVIDRIAEAVSRNPFSIIVFQDIDEADMLVRGSIARAMESGRLTDSHGREISLGNVIFILTTSWIPDGSQNSEHGLQYSDEKLTSLARGGWRLRLSVGGRTSKRCADWQHDEERVAKKFKEIGSGFSFDLNETADKEDDLLDGSRNSSDLTFDHEVEIGHEHRQSPPSAIQELLGSVDDAIFFKTVDFAPIVCNIENTITAKFSNMIGDKLQLKVDPEALEKILGGIWLGQAGLGTWLDKVLTPSIQQLKAALPSTCTDQTLVARLELDSYSENRSLEDWLPSKINVVVDIR
ncbi:SUPPRESSOR OF MAX2 1-like protein [Drosera capensis]